MGIRNYNEPRIAQLLARLDAVESRWADASCKAEKLAKENKELRELAKQNPDFSPEEIEMLKKVSAMFEGFGK